MIGIKGIAKKPITDATATTENVLSKKIFYNNSGKQTGTMSQSLILSKYSITIPSGNYTSSTNNCSSHIYNKGSFLRTTFMTYTGHGTFATNDVTVDSTTSVIPPYSGYGSGNIIFASGNIVGFDSCIPCGIEYANNDIEKQKFMALPGKYLDHEIESILDSDIKASATYDFVDNTYGGFYPGRTRNSSIRVYFGNTWYVVVTDASSLESSASVTIHKASLSSNLSINLLFCKSWED